MDMDDCVFCNFLFTFQVVFIAFNMRIVTIVGLLQIFFFCGKHTNIWQTFVLKIMDIIGRT
jgi:hypothetical protein